MRMNLPSMSSNLWHVPMAHCSHTGLFQLLLHLQVSEPDFRAVAGQSQHHHPEVLRETLGTGGQWGYWARAEKKDPFGTPAGSSSAGSCLPPQLEAEYPGEKNWLRDYCASGLYILTLLLNGYGFTEDTWSSISFRKQVKLGLSPGCWEGRQGFMVPLTMHVPRLATLTLAGHSGTC